MSATGTPPAPRCVAACSATPTSIARSARTSPLTAEFQDLITRYAWGEIWTRPGLDLRSRRLLVIGTLLALGRFDELRMHVRAALEEGGLSADEIKEVVLQQAIYCGVPAANTAFEVVREVIEAAQLSAGSGSAQLSALAVVAGDALVQHPRRPRRADAGRRRRRTAAAARRRSPGSAADGRGADSRTSWTCTSSPSPAALHDHVGVAEHRRAKLTCRAAERDAIALARGVEVPDAGAEHARPRSRRPPPSRPPPAYGAPVLTATPETLGDRSHQEVEQVEAVRGEVEEQPGACDRRVERASRPTPRRRRAAPRPRRGPT